MREGLMDDCGYHGLDECRNYESCTMEAYEQGKTDAFDDENIIEIAKRLKEYCEKHHSHNTKIGCDCPFTMATNNCYLCRLYGTPKNMEIK